MIMAIDPTASNTKIAPRTNAAICISDAGFAACAAYEYIKGSASLEDGKVTF